MLGRRTACTNICKKKNNLNLKGYLEKEELRTENGNGKWECGTGT